MLGRLAKAVILFVSLTNFGFLASLHTLSIDWILVYIGLQSQNVCFWWTSSAIILQSFYILEA